MAVIIEREMNGGTQVVHLFDNGYGASVVRGPYTYGGPEGFFEVGVIEFTGYGSEYRLTYDTPITNDVLGWLDEAAVESVLAQIEALEKKEVY